MSKTEEIISHQSHRPWDMPEGDWVYYQEWNRLIFLHFEVSFEELRILVPSSMELDTLDGKCYISVVPFTMEKIRPRILPAVGFISNFEELNVRTYVKVDGKPGVYFLNIEAGNSLSAFVSRTLSGLPYEKARMKREKGLYYSLNKKKKFFLKAEFQVGAIVQEKTELQKWLTERYCLYVNLDEDLYRYEIHHKEWEVREILFDVLELDYRFGNIHLTEDKVICPNYSIGIEVVSWGKEIVNR